MRISTIAAAIALAGAAATPSLAQTAVSATTDLNVRAGPGPTYDIVGVIPVSGSASLMGCTESGSWCQVSANGAQGWVYSKYLTTDMSGQTVVITEHRSDLQVPVVTYENDQGASTTAGAASGAMAGAIIAGPVGAVVGGAAGAATGAALNPPEQRIEYVRSNRVDPVYLEGEPVVGATLPDTVVLHQIPDYSYQYVYVNGQPVLVDPGSHQIVYVVR
ncbi:DUF1236 domain-containing protein [Consotaella salsifontis]|uniref:Uncharacterized conserved protein YraI n=1 Tax=Consotaella salsifontis TaxID=1365950 RepID=A0A1T4P373_9HYPH|nr:DUF1236 domain-containing protein [Consotaella salsifontis]SJZ85963.1 Uncharacterized conserved protein YraI [Consotaella salsifontis]